jgi:hypothetical protein
MKRLNKMTVALATAGIFSMPVNAYAFSDMWFLGPTQLANAAQWAADHLETIKQMAADKLEMLQQFASTQLSMEAGMDTSSAEISATVEKQTGAMKELTQAQLNYDAAMETAKATADAEDKYGNETEIVSMCDVAETSKTAAIAANSANINGKAMSAAYTRRDLYVQSVEAAKQSVIKDHEKYCSTLDESRGRCSKPAGITETQENADLNAGSLLAPANGSTYSDTESAAAQDFIRMVVNPIPPELLPKGVEQQPQGKAYMLATMVAAAQNSVAYNSLSQIWSSHSADAGLSAMTGESPGDALSMVGVMKKFVYSRFVEPKWKSDLAGMDTNGLLKEIAVLMAGQNWMDYQSYLQAERVEAVVATQLAIAARDHNEKRLTELRSKLAAGG